MKHKGGKANLGEFALYEGVTQIKYMVKNLPMLEEEVNNSDSR